MATGNKLQSLEVVVDELSWVEQEEWFIVNKKKEEATKEIRKWDK